jgi:Homeodomain-like domain
MFIAAALALRPGDEAKLIALTRASTVEAGLAQRARIILLAAEGVSNTEISRRVGVSRPTVIGWRQRFETGGVLKPYAGPYEAFTIDPGKTTRAGVRGEGDYITTSLVVDDPMYMDALRLYVDDENETEVYVDLVNGLRLHAMLGRDLEKLARIIQLDPDSADAYARAARDDDGPQ